MVYIKNDRNWPTEAITKVKDEKIATKNQQKMNREQRKVEEFQLRQEEQRELR